jgi:diguanylate cyclase
VLLEARRQAREWSDSGLGVVPISVNVSAVEFQSKDCLSGVRSALIATGMEPRDLELELTETVLMQDAESTVITLLDLKAMGVRVAIDDFGTGYSSFTYLRRFPVDTLKVGQSFVQEITADPQGSTLVGAMCRRHDQYRKKSEAASHCRRSGDGFAARLPSAPRVRRGARLVFQPSRCGRPGGEAV